MQAFSDEKYNLIKEVNVEKLFGYFSYNLKTPLQYMSDEINLFLLYGDNGSGKTTILNLIFHLLHPEPFGGHRSYLGKKPFKSFEIILSSGSRVIASRNNLDLKGLYTIRIYDETGGKLYDWSWEPDKQYRSERPGPEVEEYFKICRYIDNLHVPIHYLRDTRRIEGDSSKKLKTKQVIHVTEDGETQYLRKRENDDELSPIRLLVESIEDAVDWCRQKALSGTNVGYSSVNSIYNDIIKRIVTFGKSKVDSNSDTVEELKNKIIQLKERDEKFSVFGLTPKMNISNILESLEIATDQNCDVLESVLTPYFDGHNARLNALQELQEVMSNFVFLLNDFYSNKTISINLKNGITIKSDSGEELLPIMLSSGERQLLLLFCQAISARNIGSIFVIDEPEISLNVKWQRKFIPALLTCLSGTNSQIILATHSIEILSQYKDYVIPLKSNN